METHHFLIEQAKNITSRDALIDGERKYYDACCKESDYERFSERYKSYKLIGKGHIFFINGVRNEFKEVYLFFVKNF
jgi:hypothetical protein